LESGSRRKSERQAVCKGGNSGQPVTGVCSHLGDLRLVVLLLLLLLLMLLLLMLLLLFQCPFNGWLACAFVPFVPFVLLSLCLFPLPTCMYLGTYGTACLPACLPACLLPPFIIIDGCFPSPSMAPTAPAWLPGSGGRFQPHPPYLALCYLPACINICINMMCQVSAIDIRSRFTYLTRQAIRSR